jgi:expansin (peptidoglycan-binding protein)
MGSTTYKTNCGYCGTEGSATGNACNSGHNDAVANISTGAYYVAVPNWGQGASCGLCVSVSYNGNTITATVVDNCASCGSGHIDLSPAAGAALGMGTGAGQTEDPKSGVSWKTVACPVGTSSIVAVYNGNYAGQIYFQNVAFPIASASAVVGGTTHTANLTNGMWDFGITLTPGTQVTLTDIAGHTVTGTLGSNGGSLGVQFPTTC